MKKQTIEQQEAEDALRSVLPLGTTVYIQFLWVNPSGTNRLHTFFTVVDGEIWKLDGYIADYLGTRYVTSQTRPNGLETGFDNGESLVMNLSRALHKDTYALKARRWQ